MYGRNEKKNDSKNENDSKRYNTHATRDTRHTHSIVSERGAQDAFNPPRQLTMAIGPITSPIPAHTHHHTITQ